MFRKLLIGPVLQAGGCIAGSHYGAGAEQLVHNEPDAVYAAVEQAVSARDSGVVQLEDGGTISNGLSSRTRCPASVWRCSCPWRASRRERQISSSRRRTTARTG